jgi:AP-3 complex subunit beta
MIIPPLLRLTHSAPSPEVERVVLSYLVFMTRESPVSPQSLHDCTWTCAYMNSQNYFAQHYTRFFIRSRDLPQTKSAKIKILLSLISPENVQALIREFTVS